MTVSELIEELKRFPGHHVVLVAHDVEGIFKYPVSAQESFVQDVRAGEQCSVVVDASSRP